MNEKFLAAAVAIGLLVVGRQITNLSPRGLRLNNPGNIKEFHSAYIDWVGEHPLDLDPTLEEFERPEYGIRAMGKILDTYWSKRGISTIRQLVERYAPGIENDTEAYIANVSQWVGVSPDQDLDLSTYKLDLVKAIFRQEQGFQPYSDEFINSSLMLEA